MNFKITPKRQLCKTQKFKDDQHQKENIDDNEGYGVTISEDENINWDVLEEYSLNKRKDLGTIVFGKYYLDNYIKEPIEWIVLKDDSFRKLIISKYGLDWKQFGKGRNINWETSSLRKWLNEEFLDEAFDLEEQKHIVTAELTDTGTSDKVFLLSEYGVQSTLPYYDQAYICKATKHTCTSGEISFPNINGIKWWTRTNKANEIKCVDNDSYSFINFDPSDYIGVRPCLWYIDTIFDDSTKDSDKENIVNNYNNICGNSNDNDRKCLFDSKEESTVTYRMNRKNEIKYNKKSFGNNLIKIVNFGKNLSVLPSDEPMQWYVLREKNNRVLLLNKNIIDWCQFNSIYGERDWKNSTIRKWLNEDFYNKCFSDKEKKYILWTSLNDADTRDRVFLLSKNEVDYYLTNEDEKYFGKAGANAISKGAFVNKITDTCSWWTRTSIGGGVFGAEAAYRTFGRYVETEYNGVRPAIWIYKEAINYNFQL